MGGGENLSAYQLNRMMYDLRLEQNRKALQAEEEAYYLRYGLSDETVRQLKARDWKALNAAGASIYVMTKLGAALGVNLYQMGAQMKGMTWDEYQRFIAEQEERAASYALLPATEAGRRG
jgi:protocatechuate 4,5-dioxygenase alpha chain